MSEDTPTRTPEDLEKLSTRELHDRAVRRAEKHLDVRFFWSLLEMIPAAEPGNEIACQALEVELAGDPRHVVALAASEIGRAPFRLADEARQLLAVCVG